MVFFCGCLRPQPKPKRKSGPLLSTVPKYKTVDRAKCKLLQLCWDRDWDGVVARCATHPQECRVQSRNMDRTALHLATMPSGKCPEAVLLVLLETNPHAVVVQDGYQYGGTPLHFLCASPHRNNPPLVERFVQAALSFEKNFPFDTSACTDIGWSPLRLAANGAARKETLQILMKARTQAQWIAPWTGAEAYPAMNPRVVDDDEPPLLCLWNRVHTELEDPSPAVLKRMRLIADAMFANEKDASLLGISGHTDQEEAWTKLLILLCNQAQSTLVHTAASLYFPIPGLVELCIKVFPEQLQEKDSSGRLPLHSLFMCPLSPQHFQVARILVDTQPDALTVADVPTGLQPALLAASRDAPLETIFSMLRAYPNALKLQRVRPR